LIRRLNSLCKRSIAFEVRIDFHWLREAGEGEQLVARFLQTGSDCWAFQLIPCASPRSPASHPHKSFPCLNAPRSRYRASALAQYSVVDIFDDNKYAHDPTSTFLNWTIIDMGSFDYAADSWGFTCGATAEWKQDWWTARAGVFQLSQTPPMTVLWAAQAFARGA
jgi:hypothetical protein